MRKLYLILVSICLVILISACEIAPQPTPAVNASSSVVPAQPVATVQATPLTSPAAIATLLSSATPTVAASQPPPAQPTQGALLDVIETPGNPAPVPIITPFNEKPRVAPTPTLPSPPTPFPSPPPYVRRLFVAPGNPSQLFALTSNNRLARSDNGGTAWIELSTTGPAAGYLTGIGIDYRNPKTFYLTSDKGIFRSDNQGQTWTLVNSLVAQGITVSFDDPKILWTAVSLNRGGQIWKSADGGQTWPSVSSGYYGYSLAGPILIDPQDTNTLYAIAYSLYGGQYLYRGTRDNAWKSLPYPGSATVMSPLGVGLAWSSNSNTLYVGSPNGKLYGSANAKEPDAQKITWKVVADFEQAYVNVLARGEPNETLYITLVDLKTNQSKLMKSPDGGKSWQALTMP